MNLRDSLPWVDGAPSAPGVYYIEVEGAKISTEFQHLPPHVMSVYFDTERGGLAYMVTMGPEVVALRYVAHKIKRHCELIVRKHELFAPTWAGVPDNFTHWAADACGMAFYYTAPPWADECGRWVFNGTVLFDRQLYVPQGAVVDWQRSLRVRPNSGDC